MNRINHPIPSGTKVSIPTGYGEQVRGIVESYDPDSGNVYTGLGHYEVRVTEVPGNLGKLVQVGDLRTTARRNVFPV